MAIYLLMNTDVLLQWLALCSPQLIHVQALHPHNLRLDFSFVSSP